MINPFAFFRFTSLRFVKKVRESTTEDGDIWTFYFQATQPLIHTAGQHGLFVLPWLKGLHIFSLASAPEEDLVMIGTHVRAGSKYKQVLNSLKEGQKIGMFGPVLNFTLPSKPSAVVFLAQGIGITPFRSMMMHVQLQNLHVPITLIHVDSREHIYQTFTQTAAGEAHFVGSADEFNAALDDVVVRIGDRALYYTSGSPKFNKATVKRLKALGTKGGAVKKDGFLGY